MNKLWQRFCSWLFEDIMPPEDFLIPMRVVIQEYTRQLGECLMPAMLSLAVAFDGSSEAMKKLETMVEDEGKA